MANSSARVSAVRGGAAQDWLTRITLDQLGDRRGLLLLSNLLVLLLVGRCFETLPRQPSAEEVEEDVSQGLEVVSPGLFWRVSDSPGDISLCAPLTSAKVRVDAHVPRRPAQTLALPVRDVLLRLWVAILLGHAEIHDVNHVGGLCARSSDQKVVGLDVAIDEVLLVDGLDSGELAMSARRKGLVHMKRDSPSASRSCNTS
jgi:hypothetical protein